MNKYMIAWKSPGGIKSASFRYRAFLPCKYLRQKGWSCEIFNYKNLEKYQIVVFQKLYDRENLELVKILKSKGVITIFDLCDNHFYYRLEDALALAERTERLQTMLELVDVVSVSTPELKNLIGGKTDKIPVVIDDAIELPRLNILSKEYLKLRQKITKIKNNCLNIIWYGNAGTTNPPYGMIDLVKVLPSLEKLNQNIPLSLTVISNSKTSFKQYVSSAKIPVKYHPWQLSSFPYIFSQNDVCIIPISLNQLTRCKTNNRLVLSLLLGVPVVADKIPSYEEFSEFVLFSNWEKNLHRYALNSMLRQQHIEQGKEYIVAKYNRNRVVSQWSALFQTLLA
ncbi:MAG TPA: hypothetical protein V6C71_06350 [Coleofasciculaceae cyanobacterium]